jgi:hypothetical protein
MANLFAKYETDAKAEREGVELEFDGVTFLLRRAGGNNRAYRYALAAAAQKYPEVFNEDTAEADKFNLHEDLQIQAFSDAVVIGWDNLDDRDGNPLEFSKENFIALCLALPEVWDAIKEAASDEKRFKPDTAGEDLGKSLSGTNNMVKMKAS